MEWNRETAWPRAGLRDLVLAAATVALLAGSTQAQTNGPDGGLTTLPSPPGADNAVVYDIAKRRVKSFAPPISGEPRSGVPYSGGDLQGTSFSFGGFEDVDDPTQYPARVNVDIDSSGGSCSGTLIDARHVLTAGHCLYDNGAWIEDIVVHPGNSNEYGSARAILLTSFSGWTQHGLRNWDVGLITLDRPIGALTGWHGYGSASCDYMTHEQFENYSFPTEGPEPGEWAYWSGPFDWCPATYQVQRNVETSGGMSGSTFYDASLHVRAVHSGYYPAWPSGGRAVRLTDAKTSVIYDTIQAQRPAVPDLVPVGLKIDKDTLHPNVGDTVSVTGIHVHNYSKVNFNGPVTIHVKLSQNENITASDTSLWSVSGNYSIPAMKSEVLHPGQLTVPDGLQGLYHVGVWIDVADANTSNNDGSEVIHDELKWLFIQDAWWNLEAVASHPWIGEYDSWQDLPVTFRVRNLGPYDAPEWTAKFYLSKLKYQNDQTYLLGTGSAQDLAVDEDFMDTVHLPLIDVEPGKYNVWVAVSAADETHPENNKAVSEEAIIVKDLSDLAGPAPNLKIAYMGIPGGVYEKSDPLPVAFSVTNTSTNAGQWHAHFFAVGAGGQIVHLASGSAPQLLSGASFASVEQLPLDALSPGVYSLVMAVETAGETTFADNWRISANTFEIEPGLVIE